MPNRETGMRLEEIEADVAVLQYLIEVLFVWTGLAYVVVKNEQGETVYRYGRYCAASTGV